MTIPKATKAHILFASADRFPPFRVDVEVLFGQKLRELGYHIDWVLQADADQPKNAVVEWRGGSVYLGATDNGSRFPNRLRRHIRSFLNDLRIRRAQRDRQYTAVLVKDKFLAAIIAMLTTSRSKTKFLYWLSYPFPEASLYAARIGTARYPLLYQIRGRVFGFILYRLIARRASHIFVQSEQMKRDMHAQGIPNELMSAVPMGFLPEPDTGARNEPKTIPGQMVYLGTLLKTRNLDFLIRVLATVRKSRPDATLLYVGPEELPGDEEVLRIEATRLGLMDAVTITGRLPRDEAFQIVRESEVCFSPFYPTPILNSTSPTKLVEYMALGKAPVANDHPEQRDILEASKGGLCVGYDEAEFASAALWIMEHPEDAKAMSRRGYDYVMQHRTYESIAAEVANTLDRILNG